MLSVKFHTKIPISLTKKSFCERKLTYKYLPPGKNVKHSFTYRQVFEDKYISAYFFGGYMKTLKSILKYFSVVVCFATFLANDIYMGL